MSFEEPTFEEYKKANAFAKVRYKYGLFVTILCLICFLILIILIVRYGEELASHPFLYGAKKFDVDCFCNNHETGLAIYFNSTTLEEKESLLILPEYAKMTDEPSKGFPKKEDIGGWLK